MIYVSRSVLKAFFVSLCREDWLRPKILHYRIRFGKGSRMASFCTACFHEFSLHYKFKRGILGSIFIYTGFYWREWVLGRSLLLITRPCYGRKLHSCYEFFFFFNRVILDERFIGWGYFLCVLLIGTHLRNFEVYDIMAEGRACGGGEGRGGGRGIARWNGRRDAMVISRKTTFAEKEAI